MDAGVEVVEEIVGDEVAVIVAVEEAEDVGGLEAGEGEDALVHQHQLDRGGLRHPLAVLGREGDGDGFAWLRLFGEFQGQGEPVALLENRQFEEAEGPGVVVFVKAGQREMHEGMPAFNDVGDAEAEGVFPLDGGVGGDGLNAFLADDGDEGARLLGVKGKGGGFAWQIALLVRGDREDVGILAVDIARVPVVEVEGKFRGQALVGGHQDEGA